MAKASKKNKTISTIFYRNLPTQERMRIGDVRINKGILKAEDPLRIDKLLANGIIDEMQASLWLADYHPVDDHQPAHAALHAL